MTDLLSAIREFRFLEEKRRTGGLASEEQERWDQLRAILGERASAPIEAPSAHQPPSSPPAPMAAPWASAPPIEEEPPMVDADLLEDAPVAGPDPPMAPPIAAPPGIAFAGWPAAEEPVAAGGSEPAEPAESAEPADALAGWPMTEEPVVESPVAPVAAAPVWPMAQPLAVEPPAPEPAPPAPVSEAPQSNELQSGDEALLSVTEFLVQAPLASAPVPWPSPPPPSAAPAPVSVPWQPPVVSPAAPAPPAPPEPSAWFAPSAPAPPPTRAEPAAWPAPVVSPAPITGSHRINTAPPWPATPQAPPPVDASTEDPDQDLPVAVEPVAVEPDAMDLLSQGTPSGVKSERKPGVFVEGEHRVVVHTLVGALKRGTIRDLDLESPTLELSPQAGGDSEWVNSEELKAIFFMLPPGQPHLAQAGQRLTVTFHDGRQITGFSSDYRPGDPGFFLIPADTRSATARIYVFRAALRDVMAN